MKEIAPPLYVAITSRTRHMRVPRKRIFALIEFISRSFDRKIHDVDIAVIDSREMGKYNRKYFGRGGTTDVISFDLSEDQAGPLSAQVIVCGQVAARESANRGLSQQREIMLYVLHGLLHLLGYDDAGAADAAEMYLRQEDLLDEFLARYRRSLTGKRKRRKRK